MQRTLSGKLIPAPWELPQKGERTAAWAGQLGPHWGLGQTVGRRLGLHARACHALANPPARVPTLCPAASGFNQGKKGSSLHGPRSKMLRLQKLTRMENQLRGFWELGLTTGQHLWRLKTFSSSFSLLPMIITSFKETISR